MKVISKGKGWKVKKTCKGCQAVLEIETEDINYEVTAKDIATQQYELDIEGTFSVDCPECGQNIRFRFNEIPSTVKEKIKENN